MKMKTIFIILAIIIVVAIIMILASRTTTIKGTYYLYSYKEGEIYYDVDQLYDKFELKLYNDGSYTLTIRIKNDNEDLVYTGTYEEDPEGDYIIKDQNAKIIKNGIGALIIKEQNCPQCEKATFYLKRSTIST